jgi:hypothetical protein
MQRSFSGLGQTVLCCLWTASAAAVEAPLGKTPTWTSDDASTAAPYVGRPAYISREEYEASVAPVFEVPAIDRPAPKPLTTLANAVDFIRNQRGLEGQGLPGAFHVPAHTPIPDRLRALIVAEGVGLYDSALAVITLVEAGALNEAQELLDLYIAGTYAEDSTSPMELRAFPSRYNANAFSPFDESVFYYFNFTNLHGNWLRWGDRWRFWAVHTGPNAWLVNAACRYILAARAKGASAAAVEPYLALAHQVGTAMIRLQDPEAHGGVRYGPEGTFHLAERPDPYLEVNSENNVSAYAAFRLLAKTTGEPRYSAAADRILGWAQKALVWTSKGESRKGLFDPATKTLAMGLQWEKGRWVLQKEHPTDSGGTWTISALGPAQIDALWGERTSFLMWQTVRARAGRDARFRRLEPGAPLAGLDYSDAFPSDESLISPEWSAGGLYALKALLDHYGQGIGKGLLNTKELSGLQADVRSMSTFIAAAPNAYAFGPGHGGKRKGETGFHWVCPPAEVHALASVYFSLFAEGRPDPLGVWRRL